MAASLTYRSNATTKHHNKTNNTWQDVSIPRRRSSEKRPPLSGAESSFRLERDSSNLPSLSSSSSSSSSVPRKKRPREDDSKREKKRREIVGESSSSSSSSSSSLRRKSSSIVTNGDYYSTQQQRSTTSTQTKDRIHSISNHNKSKNNNNEKSGVSNQEKSRSSSLGDREERRSSLGSSNNTNTKNERRSPMGGSSINSTNTRNERRASLSSETSDEAKSSSSSTSKAARRSSMESIKSTTSTNSSASTGGGGGGGGFRRLKKFGKQKPSSLDKPIKKKENRRSQEEATATEEEEDPTAAESFQQTQLRLWKAAQERHQQLKEEQERKRLQKLQKKKLREQLQQERLQKLEAKGKLRLDDSNVTINSTRESMNEKESSKQSKRRDSLDSSLRDDSDSKGSRDDGFTSKRTKDKKTKMATTRLVHWERRTESMTSDQSSHDVKATISHDREAQKPKKLKRLKKLSRDNISERDENRLKTIERRSSMDSSVSSRTMDSRNSMDSSSASNEGERRIKGDKDGEGLKAKKKKKKLLELDSSESSRDSDDLTFSQSGRERTKKGISDEDRESVKAKKKLKKLQRESSISWSRSNNETTTTSKGTKGSINSSKSQSMDEVGSDSRSSDPKKRATHRSTAENEEAAEVKSMKGLDRGRAGGNSSEQRETQKVKKLKKKQHVGFPASERSVRNDTEAVKAKKQLKKLDSDVAATVVKSTEEGNALNPPKKAINNSDNWEVVKANKLKKLAQEGSRKEASEKEASEPTKGTDTARVVKVSNEADTQSAKAEASETKAKKKLKRLKKFRRHSESGESTTEQVATLENFKTTTTLENRVAEEQPSLPSLAMKPSSSRTTAGSESTSADAIVKKKKKRRLVKMGSIPDNNDIPRKKKKVGVEECMDDIGTETTTKPKNRDIDFEQSATRSTPNCKPTIISSLNAAPLTPLALNLANSVETQVQSPTKGRDELEVIQAASLKKKHRKNKDINKESLEDNGYGLEQPRLKKKKKKNKQLAFMDSQLHDPYKAEALPSKKKKKVQRIKEDKDEELVYDADVEAPHERGLKSDRTMEAERSFETMSDVAASETSSSATVVTGKIKKKKKKRLKKFGSGEFVRPKMDEEVLLEETETCPSEEPVPLKKRRAASAAGTTSWERNATASTAASKVSLSSSGTGPGATPEFGTEASSISEFTHPLGSTALPPPPPPPPSAIFHRTSSVPREIVSKPALLPSRAPTFEFGIGANASVMGPSVSSSEDSDSESSSCDSDTDEEELFDWANKMFGTSAKPVVEQEEKPAPPTVETSNLTPELCEMERRRQQQEEARTLSIKEVNAILQEEQNRTAPAARHWVRRSMRQPSRSLLNAPLVRKLLDKLRGNDADMVVLKMKKYLSDPDTPSMLIDAALEALEENTNCEALYIQNFNVGMKDKQVLHLLRILQMPSCNIWCLNIGETYNVTEETWEEFAEGLKKTKITHMYASEHTITAELKEEIRDTIRWNRQKHTMHNDPNNLDVIIQCTHCWWNPINAKVLRPFLRKRGFESLLHDKEAQGLRGSVSEAPAG